MPTKDRYDVVIVGAGAVGLATAYHLIDRRPELSVLVVDARRGPGEGSTGASAAMVRDVFSSSDNRQLARSSIAFYRHLMDENEELRQPSPLLDLYGYLWLLPERVLDEYRGLVRQSGGTLDARPIELADLGSCPGLDPTPARWFEGDTAPPPDAIAGGLFGRNCGAVAPDMLSNFYCKAARARGVEFAFDLCVQRLSFEGREELLLHERSKLPFSFQEQVPGRLRIARVVFGDGSSVRTDRVIVAAGAWAEHLLHPLGIATACSPRTQLLFSVSGREVDELLRWTPPVEAIDAPAGRARLPFLILPTGATLKPIFAEQRIWIGRVDRVAHPIGTREDPSTDGTLDYRADRLGDRDAFATDVLPSVSPYLPKFDTAGLRLESSWGGYYHFSPEGLPVLLEEPSGVIFVGGDTGSGVMKADALGRLVAALFDGARSAALFQGDDYRLDRLSLTHRAVEEERIIL